MIPNCTARLPAFSVSRGGVGSRLVAEGFVGSLGGSAKKTVKGALIFRIQDKTVSKNLTSNETIIVMNR
jgi:hypothetical protein